MQTCVMKRGPECVLGSDNDIKFRRGQRGIEECFVKLKIN